MGLSVKKIAIMLLIFYFSGSIFTKGDAAWNGPTEILSGGWGSEDGLFGINYGDSGDQIPDMIVISSSGKILIGDSINKRIQVFNADGKFSNLIIPKGFPISYPAVIQWPLSLFICGDSTLYTERNEYLQIYKLNGELQQNFTSIRGGIAFVDQQCNFYTYNPSAKLYSLYSPTGQLIKSTTESPLELGVEKSSREYPDGSVSTVIQYNDITFSIKSPAGLEGIARDVSGYVYGTILVGNPEHYRVYRYTKCGKTIGSVDLPARSVVVEPDTVPAKPTPDYNVLADYGKPVIAPNGDVYTWKRAPDRYSILKWTWVDDPNVPTGPDAPTNLTIAASISGLYLAWAASPQDPGCVTGYEIYRATSAGGVGSTIGTVNVGILKYNDTTAETGTTYYYKVRTVAGSEFSPYTSEVSGKR